MNNRFGLAGVILLLALPVLPGGSALAADCETDAAGNVTCVNSVPWTASIEAIAGMPGASASVTNTDTGTVTVTGPGDEGLLAMSISGNSTATNSGTVAASTVGVSAWNTNGNSTAANSGTVTAGDFGVYASSDSGNSAATNSGTVTAQQAVGLFARSNEHAASVINSGSVTAGMDGLYAMAHRDIASVTNSGTVVAGEIGLRAYSDTGTAILENLSGGSVTAQYQGLYARNNSGPASVTNSGTVTAGMEGVYAQSSSGAVSVTNSGTVTAVSTGLYAWNNSGNSTVTNSGSITVTTGSGIRTTNGDDIVSNSGTIRAAKGPAIVTGAGNDTVIIEGGAVSGLIDGGADWDRLVLPAVPTFVVNPETWANRDQFMAQIPASGSATINGHTYTWANFEELDLILRLAMLHDGRINPFDFAAPATGWCAGGGAQFYAIGADGQGEWAYNVTDTQVQAALAQALASGSHVLIADGLGVQLWALSDLSAEGVELLQLVGPGYVYIFPANTCGLTD